MIFRPEKLYFKLTSVFFATLLMLAFGLNLQAQSRRSAAAKKGSKEKAASKDKAKDKSTAKNSAKEKAKKPSKAELAEMRRRQEEARRAEEARRQAILAEQRRREQIAREARERQQAFERGLKNETLDNIAKDNTDGEDLEVRRAAVNALAGHAGTVVVIEPQTGKVLSIVNQDWAIRKGFKPCSTIKLVTGVAGLNENVIDQSTGEIRTRHFPMGLDDALAHSNNSYFQTVGTTGVGNQKMISYAKALGLGEPTGINAENEIAGKLPYGNNNAKVYSHGEDFEVTPLQLAVVVSTIANGGKKIIPQIPRTSVEKTNFHGAMRGEIDVPITKLQGVLPGMIGAVNYGTARRSGGSEFEAAGKTGSCIGQGSWLGLFASVAPVINPQLAVVVITRGSGERGKYASAIAGKVYQALSNRFKDANGKEMIAKVPLQLKPKTQFDAKASAQVDTEEGEDSDEGDVNPTAKKISPKKGGDEMVNTPAVNNLTNTQPAAPINAPAKTAAKAPQMFAPVVIQVNKQLPSRPRIVSANK